MDGRAADLTAACMRLAMIDGKDEEWKLIILQEQSVEMREAAGARGEIL